MSVSTVDLHARLTQQLDGLVVFLAAAHEPVFELIRKHQEDWLDDGDDQQALRAYEDYGCNVVHGAFLLGYSYFEAFLADVAREVLRARPTMLAVDKQISAQVIVQANSYDELLRQVVDSEVRGVFMKNVTQQREYFTAKLQLEWDAAPDLELASSCRNCLMHNNGVADERLARTGDFKVGESIRLRAGRVHEFGLVARNIAEPLWASALKKHLLP